MNGNDKENKTIRCVDCGRYFTFTPGEQRFYLSKRLSEPKRCLACRKLRKSTIVPFDEVNGNA